MRTEMLSTILASGLLLGAFHVQAHAMESGGGHEPQMMIVIKPSLPVQYGDRKLRLHHHERLRIRGDGAANANAAGGGANPGAGGAALNPNFATRHLGGGRDTTSRADGAGGRDVTHEKPGGNSTTHKSPWNNKPWATWTDTSTGKTGSWGTPPPACGSC
jgi:hypothetical protein